MKGLRLSLFSASGLEDGNFLSGTTVARSTGRSCPGADLRSPASSPDQERSSVRGSVVRLDLLDRPPRDPVAGGRPDSASAGDGRLAAKSADPLPIYLKDMATIPLLGAGRERELFENLERAKNGLRDLGETLPEQF